MRFQIWKQTRRWFPSCWSLGHLSGSKIVQLLRRNSPLSSPVYRTSLLALCSCALPFLLRPRSPRGCCCPHVAVAFCAPERSLPAPSRPPPPARGAGTGRNVSTQDPSFHSHLFFMSSTLFFLPAVSCHRHPPTPTPLALCFLCNLPSVLPCPPSSTLSNQFFHLFLLCCLWFSPPSLSSFVLSPTSRQTPSRLSFMVCPSGSWYRDVCSLKTHPHIHTYPPTLTHTYTHSHTLTNAYTHTHIFTLIHAYSHTHTYTTYTCTFTYICTHTYTYTHTSLTHSRIQTHTHPQYTHPLTPPTLTHTSTHSRYTHTLTYTHHTHIHTQLFNSIGSLLEQIL